MDGSKKGILQFERLLECWRIKSSSNCHGTKQWLTSNTVSEGHQYQVSKRWMKNALSTRHIMVYVYHSNFPLYSTIQATGRKCNWLIDLLINITDWMKEKYLKNTKIYIIQDMILHISHREQLKYYLQFHFHFSLNLTKFFL